jgi:hypothetical protein
MGCEDNAATDMPRAAVLVSDVYGLGPADVLTDANGREPPHLGRLPDPLSRLRLDDYGHDPAVLTDLPVGGEAELLVRRERSVEQESCRHRVGALGIALHRSPAEGGDQVQRPGQCGGGYAMSSVALADIAAPDSPIGEGLLTLLVGGAALDPRQFRGRPELAPAGQPSPRKTSAAWAVPARTRASLRVRLISAVAFLSPPSGWNAMHQQPPKIPLLRSTSAANAGHVDSSRGRTQKFEVAMSCTVALPGCDLMSSRRRLVQPQPAERRTYVETPVAP